MDYQLIRSQRKTLALQIDEYGALIVRAPMRLKASKIEDFIRKKSDWISKKQQNIHTQPLTFKHGDNFYYLGNRYPLLIDNSQCGLSFDFEAFRASTPTKALFNAWYRQNFANIITKRIHYYADKHALCFGKISIRQQKTRWGSCSANNNISFNYLLIMTPMSVIDYVIIHELAHTKHKNHQADFWQLVANMMPEYKQAERYLKQHSARLHQFRSC